VGWALCDRGLDGREFALVSCDSSEERFPDGRRGSLELKLATEREEVRKQAVEVPLHAQVQVDLVVRVVQVRKDPEQLGVDRTERVPRAQGGLALCDRGLDGREFALVSCDSSEERFPAFGSSKSNSRPNVRKCANRLLRCPSMLRCK
jgi:hypothetical protein